MIDPLGTELLPSCFMYHSVSFFQRLSMSIIKKTGHYVINISVLSEISTFDHVFHQIFFLITIILHVL